LYLLYTVMWLNKILLLLSTVKAMFNIMAVLRNRRNSFKLYWKVAATLT